MTDPTQAPGRARKMLLLGVIGLLVLGLLGTALWALLGKKSTHKAKPPKITLLTPATPPPPPPPRKFEKKPDPPKEQKEMKVDQPVERKVEPAPAPELKMDGPAGDGPSAFASGKITSEDISKLGSGKTGPAEKAGGLFNPHTGYANLLKGELQRYLAKQNYPRRNYVIEVLVWVAANGALTHFELVGKTRDADTDDALQAAMDTMPAFSQVPPANMPQPIRLRIRPNS